eukprot:190355-Prymnesium_polylepis.1
MRWTEYDRLYKEGRVRVPMSTLKAYVFGKYKDQLDARLAGGGRLKKGPKYGMLTEDQEDFITGLVVEMARQGRPLAPQELMRWGQRTAQLNGTRDESSQDVRAWFELLKERVWKLHGIKMEEADTQQLSKQRAAVLKSGLRAFQTKVNALLQEEPTLAARGLCATGNWDESKLDLNKLVQGVALVPEGQDAAWE